MEKLKIQTINMVDDNVKNIGELFPNCLTERLNDEGKLEVAIDFDQLKQELSKDIVEGPEERYQFTWPDKRNAIRLANTPTTDTLRPCREESVDFEKTQNLYIEGDNLEVLKLLRENYLGKVKMIYIDPPYNTGNDFVYNDDFSQDVDDYIHNSGQEDSYGNKLTINTESNGRFHTDWLNMMYPRLKVARDLLSEDGVIFISIDDNEQCNIKKLCDEIFGQSNFVGELIHQRAKGGGQAKYIVKGHDYILVYGRDLSHVTLTRKKIIQQQTVNINGVNYIKNDDVIRKVFGKYDKSLGDRRCYYEELIQYKGEAKKKEVDEKIKRGEYFLELNKAGMHTICEYVKVDDASSKLYSIIKVLSEEGKKDLEELGIEGFSYPKPVEIIRQLVEAGTSSRKDSIVLDFFSGSATTSQAVMQLNAEDGGKRKFIMVQLPEETDIESEAYEAGYKNICEIGKERIRRAGKKIKKDNPLATQDLDTGFRVLKLDSSNMKDVYYTPKDTTELTLFDDNIKADRLKNDCEDLLFQVMIELGIELSAQIEKKVISGKVVWMINGNYLLACFDEDVNESAIKEIAKLHPYYFVMRDCSMANDQVADNFEQIWDEYSKDTVRKIL